MAKYFTLQEFLWLPKLGRHAVPPPKVEEELLKTMEVMDKIRELVKSPITVTSGYRPEEYNRLIGGAKNSKHILGQACDFVVQGSDCDKVRLFLRPHLDSLRIRLEWLPGSNWIHIDRAGTGVFNP